MLRITTRESAGGPPELRVEGRIAGPWVGELERAASAHSGLSLDLAGVTFADAAGVDLLRHLIARGASVTGLAPYLEPLLGMEQP